MANLSEPNFFPFKFKMMERGVPTMVQRKQIWLGTMRFRVRSLALCSELRIRHFHELCVGCRHGSDLTLLWLWCRPTATGPVRPLARGPPYAVGVALKKRPKGKKKKMMERNESPSLQRANENDLKRPVPLWTLHVNSSVLLALL